LNDEKSIRARGKIPFFLLSLSLPLPFSRECNQMGKREFFSRIPSFLVLVARSIRSIDEEHDYLARLQDRCGKPKSFTMAPTIYPRLLSSMKGIRHKAEVWLSRESKQARTPFRSASFLMSHRGATRGWPKERKREREKEREKGRKREVENILVVE